MRQPVPFGKYLLLDRISVGGMAEVFKAKSYGVEGFEKIIAIKRILPTMGEDRDFIKMFIDEAKIAGQLAHANICQIFELGRIDGSHFIAMEYIWGKDLLQIQNRLRKLKQGMPVGMACFTIAKVLEGLDYAHRKRDPLGRPLEIVHRDCSPQNVLVSYEGEVKVIDFGIAKATSRNSRTMAGVLKGKFGYMSPEQVRGLPLDRRSDIFALGTMLYECLTGERLFQGETDFSTLEKVRNVDIRPPRELNPQIPEAVERVILKALAKDVDDRYQWCSEMLADLQQYLMSQDAVYTAKSLSSWLKEVFIGEIDKERALLEQYKRVGRDGLIAGLPAAEAKMDVIDNLGEAPAPEGDPTMLGSPSFDEMESAAAVGATPEVGPALGSPAARGRTQAEGEDSGDGDFGEEAPTEIFGEIDHGAKPAQPAPAAAAQPQKRAPSASQPAPKQPPRPPPGSPPNRAQTQQPVYASSGGTGPRAPAAVTSPMPPGMAAAAPHDAASTLNDADQVNAQGYAQNYAQLAQPSPPAGFAAQGYPANPQGSYGQQPYGQQPYGQQHPGSHSGPLPMATGTPGAMQVTPPPQPINAPAGQQRAQNAGQTLMGAAPPPGMPSYGQGYPPPTTGQQPYAYPPPSGPYASPYPMQPQQVPHSGQMPSYGQGYQGGQPTAAVDALPPAAEGKKRSSIGRDVAIGVGIAALVLGGFLAVKFLILDKGGGSSSDSGTTTSSIATIKLSLPAGISADLFVDDKKIATVSDKQEIPVTAGQRKVKLIGPNGARCEQELKLPAGKTTPLECAMDVKAAGSAAGSATIPSTGTKPADTKATDTKSIDTKSTDTKSTDAKSTDTKATETKSTDLKSGDTKASGTKVTDTKSVDTRMLATKPADTKATDPKATDTKSTDAKALATKPGDTKATDTKTPATRTGDTKATDTKALATKATDAKATDAKATDTKATATKPTDKTVKATDKLPAEDKKPMVADTKGYLAVSSKPTAKISVDGIDTGMSTPISGKTLSLTPGKHKVTFTIGNDKFTFAVNIKAGATETLAKDLQ